MKLKENKTERAGIRYTTTIKIKMSKKKVGPIDVWNSGLENLGINPMPEPKLKYKKPIQKREHGKKWKIL